MGEGLRELMETIAGQGIKATGPWFTHHLRMDPAVFDFEIGVPVASPVSPVGRVKAGERIRRRAARTIFHGGYDGLEEAWGEFDQWIKTHGYHPGEDLWESYKVGPDTEPYPGHWQTELTRPLVQSQ
jgi:effector-binding domain-containing protein